MIDNIRQVLQECVNINLVRVIISNPKSKEGILKIKVRPVLLRDALHFQCESFTKTQAFQKNVLAPDAIEQMMEWMDEFRQMQLETTEMMYTILVSKKGKATIQKKLQKGQVEKAEVEHNRKKQYILEEGMDIPFMQDLGVMTQDGKIVKSKFHKFRQINRFLEFIEDVTPALARDREVKIIDFGCGKSYLTFAIYYYLHVLKQYDVNIIGLDLKKDVIEHCSKLGKKYGYEKLQFLQGDIADYTGTEQVDMVVTLHACDTATDMALAKAIHWDAKVILSVPCCQHELNSQMNCEPLAPILQYGLIKERIASLVTDGLRAEYLRAEGYDVQVLEFIETEHTPKNILIRGVKTSQGTGAQSIYDQIASCNEFFQVNPTLGNLLNKESYE